jgi:hypothetical protein
VPFAFPHGNRITLREKKFKLRICDAHMLAVDRSERTAVTDLFKTAHLDSDTIGVTVSGFDPVTSVVEEE